MCPTILNVQPPLFRPVSHPGQSEYMVHFCGRGREAAESVKHLSAQQRLESILTEGLMRAFPSYWSPWPVACFSESNPDGIKALIASNGFHSWGLVLSREAVWKRGGGPVWYIRGDMIDDAYSLLSPKLTSWLVKTEPGQSEWMHEREWRIPSAMDWEPFVQIRRSDLVAILIGDQQWRPPSSQLTQGVPLWCWSAGELWNVPA